MAVQMDLLKKSIQGFSLVEVLISLLLVTTASSSLLKYFWQNTQNYNQVQTTTLDHLQTDNKAELAVNYE